MSQWRLPTSLIVNGIEYEIETDFRAILDILEAQNDCDLTGYEKAEVMIRILFLKWETIPEEDIEEAIVQACNFIDAGHKDDGRPKPRLMDWEQDAPIMIPAINKTLGKEIRAEKYMHWWTFLGAYMEIGECLFSTVVSIRDKKARHKKLEKYEQEFYKQNRNLIDLQKKYSEEQKEEMDSINKWL